MTTPLITTLRESCGYLKDEGFHQTAQLMILAARQIEELNARIRELEDELRPLPDNDEPPHAPEASNQNGVRLTAVSSPR